MARGMSEYIDEQLHEALGAVNKWYCSQCYGYEVTDPDVLLAYYIKHGGAWQFRQRHLLAYKTPPAEPVGAGRS